MALEPPEFILALTIPTLLCDISSDTSTCPRARSLVRSATWRVCVANGSSLTRTALSHASLCLTKVSPAPMILWALGL